MKKIAFVMLFALLVTFTATTVPVFADEVQLYTLNDKFGLAPLSRSFSEEIVRDALNSELSVYSEYGYAARLTSDSTQRGYITYDVDGVTEAEVTAIVSESIFGSNHGWGVSLGVADNQSGSIDLKNIYPIYLSKDGKPFLFYENKFWGYIADPKYSFIPEGTPSNPSEQLRSFNVPNDVKGEVSEDGTTVISDGFLYPMINLEYCTGGAEEWTPMSLSVGSGNYEIIAAEFIGADKMYDVTVKIKNIPENATKVRIGANYIRKTLKPAYSEDYEDDVYISFPRRAEESLFITEVKLTLDSEYTGGYEETRQTGIAVDTSAVRRYYAFGEQFNDEGIVFYDVYNGGMKEQSTNPSVFNLDSSAFDSYAPGIFTVKIKKDTFETSYKVQVVKPSRLELDTTALKLSIESGEEFSASGLKVSAVSAVPQRGTISVVIPEGKYCIDASLLDSGVAGTYQVFVTVGEGANSIKASFDVTVNSSSAESNENGGGYIGILIGVTGVVIIAAVVVVIMLKRKKA